MKPRWYEWIPVYGMFKYFKRYFSKQKTTFEEAVIAQWVELYHLFASFMVCIFIILLYLTYFK